MLGCNIIGMQLENIVLFGAKNLFDNAHPACSVKEVDNVIICFGVKNSNKFGYKQIFYKIVSKSQLFVDETVFLIYNIYVHQKRYDFSLSPYLQLYQGTLSHQCCYISSTFSNCIQNDVTSQHFSWDVRLKNPRPILL